MMQSVDVCIRGAGIVGQTLALLLARERLRVALVQQSAPQGPDVRAYALNAASKALLDSVRVWPDAGDATAVRWMQVESRHSAQEHGAQVRFAADALGVDALTWIVDVPALEAKLAQAIDFQPQIQRVTTPVPAALTVVCEGKASQTRADLGVSYVSTPYHQSAVATRIVCEQPHRQTAFQWFNQGEILAFLPLAGETGNSVAVVWSVSPERAAQLLALPPEALAQELMHASQGVLGQVSLCAPAAAWPLTSAHAQSWVGTLPGQPANAWALAGDAAHAVHPLAGQGLNIGLADVAELVRLIKERDYWRPVNDAKLLRRYERARKAALLTAGGAMDGLQQVLTRMQTPIPGLRDLGLWAFENSGPLKRWVAQRAMLGL